MKTDPDAASFWDTHTFPDCAAKTTEARIRFAKRPKRAMAIRLDPEDITKVEALAQRKGLSYTALIRMWIKEHLAGWGSGLVSLGCSLTLTTRRKRWRS